MRALVAALLLVLGACHVAPARPSPRRIERGRVGVVLIDAQPGFFKMMAGDAEAVLVWLDGGPTAAASIGQVDLGSRLHRHRSLHSLSVQAAEGMATMLDRARFGPDDELEQVLTRADGSVVPLNLATRPAVAALRGATGVTREAS